MRDRKLVLRDTMRKMSLDEDDDEVSLGRAGQCLGMKCKSIRNTSVYVICPLKL